MRVSDEAFLLCFLTYEKGGKGCDFGTLHSGASALIQVKGGTLTGLKSSRCRSMYSILVCVSCVRCVERASC